MLLADALGVEFFTGVPLEQGAPLDPVGTANLRHPLTGAQRIVLRRCSLEFRYLMYLVRFALFDRNRPQLEGR